jgi:glycine cleavage system H protein
MYPQTFRFTKDHEWVSVQDSTATFGITDYAQQQLGDVVFVQLPDIGARLKAGDVFGSIESVKAVNDLFAPVSGEVTEVNAALANSPEIVNKDPHATGWFLKLRMDQPADTSALMDAESYQKYTAELGA